jgi:transmembrane 9 superfamily protein 3
MMLLTIYPSVPYRSYKFYYVYGFMLLVCIILSMVTVCTTIVSVYFILNIENYKWQWVAMGSAGSTSLYVFMYSVFYFYYKTQMTGLLQVSYYFGYMFLFCTAMFCMCGSLGVAGANIFVHKVSAYTHIYIYAYTHICVYIGI